MQRHSFWEIRDGRNTKLWEDSWNHLPRLGDNPRWAHIWENTMAAGRIQVHHFWHDRNLNGRRCWNFIDKPDQMDMVDCEVFQEEIVNWFIRLKEGPNVLRWGYTDRGMFSIKEAYNIQIENRVGEEEIWKKIWTLNLWPKVGLFA